VIVGEEIFKFLEKCLAEIIDVFDVGKTVVINRGKRVRLESDSPKLSSLVQELSEALGKRKGNRLCVFCPPHKVETHREAV
jgi:hypothetical protein